MANIIVPTRMPRGIPRRSSTSRTRIQNGRVVSALAIHRLETAMQHLAAARRLGTPCAICDNTFTVAASYRWVIAVEPYVRYGVVWAEVSADQYTTVTIDFTSDSDPTGITLTSYPIIGGSDTVTSFVSVTLAIGSGVAGVAPTYEAGLIEFSSGTGVTMTCRGYGVLPLPLVEPHVSGGITT